MIMDNKCLFLAIALLVISKVAFAGISGHSGMVFHVDKHGHWSGHSSHYDYRFYPEKSLLGYLMDHHHSIDDHHHNLGDHHMADAYGLIDDHGYHSDPYYYMDDVHPSYHSSLIK